MKTRDLARYVSQMSFGKKKSNVLLTPTIGKRRAQGLHFTKDNMENNETVTVCHGLKTTAS